MSFRFSTQIQPPRPNWTPTTTSENFDAMPAMHSAGWCGFNVNVSPNHLLSRRMITEAPLSAQIYNPALCFTSSQTVPFAPPVPYFNHNNQTYETLRPLYNAVPLPQFSYYDQFVTQPQSISSPSYGNNPQAGSTESAYHPVEINGTTFYFDHSLAATTNFIHPSALAGHSGAPTHFNNTRTLTTTDAAIMPAITMNRPFNGQYLLELQNQREESSALPLSQIDTASLHAPKENTPHLLSNNDVFSFNFDIQDIMSLQPVIREKLENIFNTQFSNLIYLNAQKVALANKLFRKPTNEDELSESYDICLNMVRKRRPAILSKREQLIDRLAIGLKNTEAFRELTHVHTEIKIDQETCLEQVSASLILHLILMFFCPYQKVKNISLNTPYLCSTSTLYATSNFDAEKHGIKYCTDNNKIRSPAFIMICDTMQVFQQSFSVKMKIFQSQEASNNSDENIDKEDLKQYFYCFCDFALKYALMFEKESLEIASFRYVLGMSSFLEFIIQLSEYQQDYEDDFIYVIRVQLGILNSYRIPQIINGINHAIQTQINSSDDNEDHDEVMKVLINFLFFIWKSLSITLEFSLSYQRLDLVFSHFEIIRKGHFFSNNNFKKMFSKEKKILLQNIEQHIARSCCIVLSQLKQVLCDNSKSYSEGLDPFVKRLENDILPLFEDIKNQLSIDIDRHTTIEKENCQICIMQNTLEQIKADILAIDPQLKVSNTLIDDLLRTIQSTVENIEQKEKEKHHSLEASKKCRTLLKQPFTASIVEQDTNTNIQVANTEITEVFSVENRLSQLIHRAEDIIQSSEMKEALELEDLNAIHEHCSDIAEHHDFLCWIFGELAFQTYFAQRKEFVRALKYIEQCKELYILCTKLSDDYDSSNTSLNSVTWFKENNPSGSLKEKNIISLFSISTQSEIRQLNKKLVLINLLYVKSMECIEEARQYLLKNITSPTCSSQELEFMTARLERFISHLEFLEKNALEIEQYQVLMKPYIDFNALMKRRKAFLKKLGLYGNNPNRQTERKSKSGLYELVEASKRAANISEQTIIVNFSAHSTAFRSARENLQQFLDKDKSNPLSNSQENVSDIGSATASYVPSHQ